MGFTVDIANRSSGTGTRAPKLVPWNSKPRAESILKLQATESKLVASCSAALQLASSLNCVQDGKPLPAVWGRARHQLVKAFRAFHFRWPRAAERAGESIGCSAAALRNNYHGG